MISNKLQEMINNQINAELWSAYFYLSMSLDADSHGYRGVSNWFYIQSREELDHARILQKYLLAQECRVILKPIGKVQLEWKSPLEMFQDSLSQEKIVTRLIHDIMNQAQAEKDYATCSQLMWFVDEQVEEEDQCVDLVQRFTNASNAPCCFMQIDYDLQKRVYESPSSKRRENWYA